LSLNSKTISLKLTPSKLKQLESAMDLLEEHIGKVAGVWPQVSSKQKQAVMEKSPILSRFVALAEQVV